MVLIYKTAWLPRIRRSVSNTSYHFCSSLKLQNARRALIWSLEKTVIPASSQWNAKAQTGSLGCVNVTEIRFCREAIDTQVTAGSILLLVRYKLQTTWHSRPRHVKADWNPTWSTDFFPLIFTKLQDFIYISLKGQMGKMGKEGERARKRKDGGAAKFPICVISSNVLQNLKWAMIFPARY